MIKSLQVKNFQSHEHTELDLVPGINVILGRSQAGKTAMLRGLLWVATNRPGGLRFRSHFAKKDLPTEVRVVLPPQEELLKSDALVLPVSLKKFPSKTATYSVGKQTFKGFATNVPNEVKEVFNINPDVNIQKQLDAPFLITSTPTEVARIINGVTRLENGDKWLKDLNRIGLTASRELKLLEQQKDEVDVELKKYMMLDDFENDLERLAVVEREVDLLEQVIDDLHAAADRIEEIDEDTAAARTYLLMGERLDIAQEALEDVRQTESAISELRNMLTLVESAAKHAEDSLGQFETVSEELANLLHDLKKCPFCFATITADDVQEIMEQL